MFNRRQFLTSSATLAAGLGLEARAQQAQGAATKAAPAPAPDPVFKTKPKKAMIQRVPTEAYLNEVKAAGFDGLEAWAPMSPAPPIPLANAEKTRAIADKLGMRLHSVIFGTAQFSSPDKAVLDRSIADVEAAIQLAKVFGADTLLLVPCRIEAKTPGGAGNANGILMPRPWEFQLEWDRRNGHVSRVVAGDNAPYAAYIQAQNRAVDTSTEIMKRMIPVAEKAGIVLAIENVWNNLWVKPDYFKHFVESFQSPWVKVYYDIGNHVKFGAPEEWILTLGSLIVKVHVKDFLLNPLDADGQGRFVNNRDGSVRWPIVRTALEQINYNGWMTIEGGTNITVAEQNARLDLILAGK
jgi:L-ribulose-5-phosphate 3-epimerase